MDRKTERRVKTKTYKTKEGGKKWEKGKNQKQERERKRKSRK